MANLKTIPLAAALALSPFAQGPAAADDAPFLPTIATTTTIPSNGDLNPYGITFVPPNFSKGKGPALPGRYPRVQLQRQWECSRDRYDHHPV